LGDDGKTGEKTGETLLGFWPKNQIKFSWTAAAVFGKGVEYG